MPRRKVTDNNERSIMGQERKKQSLDPTTCVYLPGLGTGSQALSKDSPSQGPLPTPEEYNTLLGLVLPVVCVLRKG